MSHLGAIPGPLGSLFRPQRYTAVLGGLVWVERYDARAAVLGWFDVRTYDAGRMGPLSSGMDWVTETAVPCFRPHVRRDPAGTVLYEVTAADIDEIARNSATYTVEFHGNKPPITEGHRDFATDARESGQPLVMGYLENFRKGNLPDGTPAVVCDRKYMTQHAQTYQRHPFASVDYLPTRKAIVGLAKLTRPPALNIGAVYYPGTNEPVYVYAAGDDTTAANPNTPAAAQPPAQPQPPQPGATAAPPLTPEEQAGCEKVYAYLCSKYAWFGAQAQQYDAAQANPSATNTGVPEAEKGKKQPDTEGPKEKVETMAADAATIQKYEADLAKVKADLQAERDRRNAAEVDALLDQLEKVERYQFDRAAERADLLPMDDAARTARADRIRKYHPREEGEAGRIETYRGTVGGPMPATTQKQSTRAREVADEKKIDYAKALELVKSGKA